MASELYEQRVVYAALKRMTDDRNLIKVGYEHWESALCDKPFDVFEVVAGLTSHLDLGDAERKNLMIAMHAASARLVDELSAVPPYITSGAANIPAENEATEAPTNMRSVSAHKAVTERYLQLVSQHVKRQNNESFRELVLIISDEGLAKLKKSLNPAVKAWGSSGLDKINFNDDISQSDCEDLALEFYVLLSEIIGPVDADVIVNKAIGEVISMDAAQKFNPRNLL